MEPNSRNKLATIGAIVGIFVGFLTGGYIFYQIGRDNLSNTFEGERILLKNKIDSLRHNQLTLHSMVLKAEKQTQDCIDRNDSIVNENKRLNKLITESKYLNNRKIASLIKTGKSLLDNNQTIQEWLNECTAFLERNYKEESANFLKVTKYKLSEVGQRKQALENGINILRNLK